MFVLTSFVLLFTAVTVAVTSSIAAESSSIPADISEEFKLAVETLPETRPTIFSNVLESLVIFFMISCNVSINILMPEASEPISSVLKH